MALHQMKSKDWKEKETRCSATVSSGKRCKIMVEAGDYLCEHHAMDLPHFVQNPNHVASLMKARFPKRHHPACDRKGQNDCSCHNYSNGALTAMALREAFRKAGVQDSTYHRVMSGEFHLRESTAQTVWNFIIESKYKKAS